MKFLILGSGSSMGVPWNNGYFGNCNLNNKKNHRTRCSALIKTDKENILIDTSPDLRNQLLDNKIKNIDKVLFSHSHADQTHGINDLRSFYITSKKQIPIFADKETSKYLLKSFGYCFKNFNNQYPATLKLNKLKKKSFFIDDNKKVLIKPVIVEHGRINNNCFIINKKLAYISDVSKIFKKDYNNFMNLKYLVIDCLRIKYHSSHLNLDNVLNLVKIFKPHKTYLTNMNTDLDYDQLKKKLPKYVIPAYDGLEIKL